MESRETDAPVLASRRERREAEQGTRRPRRQQAQVPGQHRWVPRMAVLGTLAVATGEGTLAVRLDGKTGDVTRSNVVWSNRKMSPFVPSPGVYRGLVYVVADKGIVTCLEGATGKQVWKERLGEQYHASVVAGDGKLYFASKEGVVRVVQAGPTYRLLAANDLGEPLIASPAISDGQIFLRGEKHLFCVGGK